MTEAANIPIRYKGTEAQAKRGMFGEEDGATVLMILKELGKAEAVLLKDGYKKSVDDALWIPPVNDCEWIRRWKEERNKKDYWLEFNACVVQRGDLEAECKTLREQVGRLSKYVCTNGVNKVCNCCGRFPHKKDCEIAFIASRTEEKHG
jgi:hypothetical protein